MYMFILSLWNSSTPCVFLKGLPTKNIESNEGGYKKNERNVFLVLCHRNRLAAIQMADSFVLSYDEHRECLKQSPDLWEL